MKHVHDVTEKDVFAKSLGIEIVDLAPGRATARMNVTPQHHNGLAIAHGGVIFTLADTAFAAACNSHGVDSVAISANILFSKAVAEGVITAEAVEDSLSRKVGAYTVRVRDQQGDVIATFQGLCYRKSNRQKE